MWRLCVGVVAVLVVGSGRGPVVGGEHVGHGGELVSCHGGKLVSCHGKGRVDGCREAWVGCGTDCGKVGIGHRGVGCQDPSFSQVPGELLLSR